MKTLYRWQHPSLPKPERKMLRQTALKAAELAGLPVSEDWILHLIFLPDRAMAAANEEYVGHQGSTDVITFGYFEADTPLFPGEIGVELLICPDAARREGEKRKNSSYSREVLLYMVHGLLHAAGEDDLDPVSRARMRRRERQVMKQLNVDPEDIFPSPESIIM